MPPSPKDVCLPSIHNSTEKLQECYIVSNNHFIVTHLLWLNQFSIGAGGIYFSKKEPFWSFSPVVISNIRICISCI